MGILWFGVVIAAVCITRAVGQVDLNNSYTIDKMPIKDKVLFLADYLINNPSMFNRLEKVFKALTSSGVAGNFLSGNAESGLFNFVLDSLPTLLSNPLLPGVMTVIKEEIDDVNVTDIGKEIMKNNLKPGDKKYDEVFAQKFLPRINILRLIHRVLALSSVKSFLPLELNSTLSAKCYDKTVLYLDSLKGSDVGQDGDGQDVGLDWRMIPWANKMLFSSGLIADDQLKMDALIDSCQSVKVFLSAGTVLAGNTSLDHDVHFGTQFCNVTFSVHGGVREMFGMISGKQKNTLSWGLCIPMTCSNDDVINLFKLGELQRLFHVSEVNCGIHATKPCHGIGSPPVHSEATNMVSSWIQLFSLVLAFHSSNEIQTYLYSLL